MPTTSADPTQGLIWPALLLLVIVAGILLLIALGWMYFKHRRIHSLTGMQQRLQLATIEVDQASSEKVLEQLAGFELYHAAHWQLQQLYEGAANDGGEGALRVIDLRGDPFSKMDNAEIRVTVVMLSLPELDLPKFIVVPKNFWTRTFATGAANDIQFGDAFSRHNTLVSSDPMLVRQLFNLPVRNVLRINKDMTIEGRGDTLLLYRFPQTMDGLCISTAVQLGLDLTQVMGRPGKVMQSQLRIA